MSDAPLVHHLALYAADFAASERIFTAALAELAVRPLHRAEGVAEYWRESDDRLSFSLEQAHRPGAVTTRMHVAFTAADRDAVDRFHEAAVAAGAVSKHAPRYWPEYRAYCAFVRDADDNNIEAVHKEVPEGPGAAADTPAEPTAR